MALNVPVHIQFAPSPLLRTIPNLFWKTGDSETQRPVVDNPQACRNAIYTALVRVGVTDRSTSVAQNKSMESR